MNVYVVLRNYWEDADLHDTFTKEVYRVFRTEESAIGFMQGKPFSYGGARQVAGAPGHYEYFQMQPQHLYE